MPFPTVRLFLTFPVVVFGFLTVTSAMRIQAQNLVFASNCCLSGSSVSIVNNVPETQAAGLPVPGSVVAVATSLDGMTVFAATQTPDTVSAIQTSSQAVLATANLTGPAIATILSLDGLSVYVAHCLAPGLTGCYTGVVDVLRTSDLTLIASIALPQGKLAGLSLDAAGGHLYASTSPSQGGGVSGIASIDTSKYVVSQFVPTPQTIIGNIVVLPSTNNAYAADLQFSAIHRIDLSTGQNLATIRLSNRATGMVLSPDASVLYVVGQDLTAINTSTNAVKFHELITPITAGITVSPDGSKCYIADYYESTLDTFDVRQQEVTARVPTGFRPVNVVVSPDGSTSYVAASGSSTVSEIDATTNTLIAKAEAESEPTGIHISPDGKFVYAVNAYSSNVSVMSTQPFARLTNIPTGYLPMYSVLSPDGLRLYVSNYDATITVIDTVAQQVVDTIKTAPDGSTQAFGLAINSSGKRLYALTGYNTFHGVLVIDTATDAVLQHIPIAGDIAQIAIASKGDTAYISGDTNQPFLIVVDLGKGQQTDPLFVHEPFGVKIAPRGKFIYTGATDRPCISVINRENGQVVSRTQVAGNVSIALDHEGSRLFATGPVVTVLDTASRTVVTTVDTGGLTLGIDAE